MSYAVLLTRGAEQDLESLYAYVSRHDCPENANRLLDNIETTLSKLSDHPHRGAHPKELAALGIADYREVFFKPYRIIYRVMGEAVYVYLIADGRRDMQSLLQQRLLSAN